MALDILRRRELLLVIANVVFFVMILEYFFGVLSPVATAFRDWVIILTTFGFAVGFITVSRQHIRTVLTRQGGPQQWVMSIYFLFLMVVTIIFGLIEGQNGTSFRWMFNTGTLPSVAALNGLMGFFYTNAAYRAFKARSKEAMVLIVVCIIVMLRNVPIGEVIWEGIPALGAWFLDYPTAAAFRAVTIGMGIGMLSLALRVLLGHERAFLE